MGGAGPASWWVQPLPEPQDPTAQPDLQGVPSDPCGAGLPQGLDLLYSQLPQAGPVRAGTGEGLAAVSSVHGILQAGILEWVAIPFSKGSSQPRG